MIGVAVPNLTGGFSAMMPNHHITKPVLIGEIQDDGQFNTVWRDLGPGAGRRVVGLSRGLEGPDLRLAGADVLRQLQRQDRQVRRHRRQLTPWTPLNRPEAASVRLRRLLPDECRPACADCSPSSFWSSCGFVGPAAAQSLDDALAKFASTKFDDIEAGIAGVADQRQPARRPRSSTPCGAGDLLVRSAGQARLHQGRRRQPASTRRPARPRRRRRRRRFKPVRVNNRVRRADRRGDGQPDPDEPGPASAGSRRRRQSSARATPRRCRRSSRRSPPSRTPTCQAGPGRGARGDPAAMPVPPSRCGSRRWRHLRERGDRRRWRSWPMRARHGAAVGPTPLPTAAWPRSNGSHGDRRRGCRTSVFGISLGSVLLLAAIGLAITFGVMGVINMAHGEMVMLGAYTTFVIQEFCPHQLSRLAWNGRCWSPCPRPSWSPAPSGVLIERR